MLTKDFVALDVSAQRSGSGVNKYGWYVLIDVKRKMKLVLDTYMYNASDNGERVEECRSTVAYRKGKFMIDNKSSTTGQSCIATGTYEIRGNALVLQGGNYNEFLNLNTVEKIKEQFPECDFKEATRYNYGDDEEGTGYEVWRDSELLFFFTENTSQQITGISVISPQFEFGRISTATTIGEVIKLYPNLKLTIDLINDWEYMYVPDLKITLYFKTNDMNRVAKYKFDKKAADMAFRKVIRPETKIDLIQTDLQLSSKKP